jgi:hypothetical protein
MFTRCPQDVETDECFNWCGASDEAESFAFCCGLYCAALSVDACSFGLASVLLPLPRCRFFLWASPLMVVQSMQTALRYRSRVKLRNELEYRVRCNPSLPRTRGEALHLSSLSALNRTDSPYACRHVQPTIS